MGTIVTRKRTDGSSYYTAQIVIKSRGKVHREARSFDRKQAANAWIVRREEELRKPGGLERASKDPKLADVIDKYLNELRKRDWSDQSIDSADHQELRHRGDEMQPDQ